MTFQLQLMPALLPHQCRNIAADYPQSHVASSNLVQDGDLIELRCHM